MKSIDNITGKKDFTQTLPFPTKTFVKIPVHVFRAAAALICVLFTLLSVMHGSPFLTEIGIAQAIIAVAYLMGARNGKNSNNYKRNSWNQ